MELNRKMSRRSFLRTGWMVAAGFILTPGATATYARYAEPKWIEIKKISISLPRLPEVFKGIKIVQFSDIHLGFHFSLAELQALVDRVNGLQPDLICFTGDLVDYAVGSDAEDYRKMLSQLKAPLGKYAVLGNHDYYGDVKDVGEVLVGAGFDVLTNRNHAIMKNGSKLWVAGIDDMWEGKPDLAKALANIPASQFVLLLSHAPDFADVALEKSVDLQLSGHSHGGQVRLPGYGPITVPKYGQKYPAGHYSLGNGKLQLYTNRGIGVSMLPVRMFCRPEITVFTLNK